MKKIAIIPARAGSKRLPRKNVLPLGGKPLICWTLDAAIDCNIFDEIVVSTDDPEIIAICESYKVHIHKRDNVLASDTAKSSDVVLDVIEHFRDKLGKSFDIGVLLQPTSPLRSGCDILKAISVFEQKQLGSVVSFSESTEHLHLMTTFNSGYRLDEFYKSLQELPFRSQDFVPTYSLNGAIYIFNINAFLLRQSFFLSPGEAYIMSKENSVDIDEKKDLDLCEEILSKK